MRECCKRSDTLMDLIGTLKAARPLTRVRISLSSYQIHLSTGSFPTSSSSPSYLSPAPTSAEAAAESFSQQPSPSTLSIQTVPIGPIWALFRGGQTQQIEVCPAYLREARSDTVGQQYPIAIQYEEGCWEPLTDFSRIRERKLSDTTFPLWETPPFISTTYEVRPDFLLDQPEKTIEKMESKAEDDFINWKDLSKEKKKGKNNNKSTQSNSATSAPKKKPPTHPLQKQKQKVPLSESPPSTPQKQTKIPEFFSPAAPSPSSPSPLLTVNGRQHHTNTQTTIASFLQPPSNSHSSATSLSSSSFTSSSSSSSSSSAASTSLSSSVQSPLSEIIRLPKRTQTKRTAKKRR